MPYFFFSYARKDDRGGKDGGLGHLGKFYEDLEYEIGSLSKLSEEKIGFRDTSSIEPGEQWPEQLAEALNVSRVFIYMHSPTYFARPMCGKEWQVFRTRIDEYVEENQDCQARPCLMVPVLWIPTVQVPVPDCVSNIQYSHEDFGDIYAQDGLYHMMRLSMFEDAYQRFLREFAKRIMQVAENTELPGLDTIPEIKDVENAFEEKTTPQDPDSKDSSGYSGPRCAQFVYVAGKKNELKTVRNNVNAYGEEGGRDWKPYFPEVEEEIAIISQRVATDEKFYYEVFSLTNELTDMIQKSRDRNEVVVLIVDPWTLELEFYSSVMQKYDNFDFFNCSLLIVFNDKDNETKMELPRLELTVKATFVAKSTHEKLMSFRSNVGGMKEFEEELAKTLRYVRNRIIKVSQNIRRVSGEGPENIPTLDPSGGI